VPTLCPASPNCPPHAGFERGDANADGSLDIADAVTTLNYLFAGQTFLPCLDAADANDDGALDIADAVYILNYLFGNGPEPPEPFDPDELECGWDPTPDKLDCKVFPPCGI